MLIRSNYNKIRDKIKITNEKSPCSAEGEEKARYPQGRECSISFTCITTIINYYTDKTK